MDTLWIGGKNATLRWTVLSKHTVETSETSHGPTHPYRSPDIKDGVSFITTDASHASKSNKYMKTSMPPPLKHIGYGASKSDP
jgi:hypothetical protein